MQRGLIPVNLLENSWLFDGEISNEQLQLMESPISDLLSNNAEHFKHFHEDDKYEKNISCAWICVVVSHPDASTDELVALSKLLNIKPSTSVILGAAVGNLDFVKKIFSKNGVLAALLIQTKDYRSIAFSIDGGHDAVTDYLKTTLPMLYEALVGAYVLIDMVLIHSNNEFSIPIISYLVKQKQFDYEHGHYIASCLQTHLKVIKAIEETENSRLKELITPLSIKKFRKSAKREHKYACFFETEKQRKQEYNEIFRKCVDKYEDRLKHFDAEYKKHNEFIDKLKSIDPEERLDYVIAYSEGERNEYFRSCWYETISYIPIEQRYALARRSQSIITDHTTLIATLEYLPKERRLQIAAMYMGVINPFSDLRKIVTLLPREQRSIFVKGQLDNISDEDDLKFICDCCPLEKRDKIMKLYHENIKQKKQTIDETLLQISQTKFIF